MIQALHKNVLMHRFCGACLLALSLALLGACAPRVPPPMTQRFPAEFPENYYQQAATLGKNVLRVEPDRSLVTIHVRRAGRLARLGHDHVVASRHVQGYIAPDEGRADLFLPLDRLTVDEPALLAEAGFDTQPSPDAIDGTRRNMLDKVLEAQHFPFALIHARLAGARGAALKVTINLHGVTRVYDVPAQVDVAPGRIAVTGRMTIHQTEFGITPFSVLGGALQVSDRVDMQFSIVAANG